MPGSIQNTPSAQGEAAHGTALLTLDMRSDRRFADGDTLAIALLDRLPDRR